MSAIARFFSFIAKPVILPGTGNMYYQQNTTFPPYDVRGAGRPIAHQFSPFAPQIIQEPIVTNVGLGGLFTGQYVSQPLSEPSNNGIS